MSAHLRCLNSANNILHWKDVAVLIIISVIDRDKIGRVATEMFQSCNIWKDLNLKVGNKRTQN